MLIPGDNADSRTSLEWLSNTIHPIQLILRKNVFSICEAWQSGEKKVSTKYYVPRFSHFNLLQMLRVLFLFLLETIGFVSVQDIYTLTLLKMTDTQYQCNGQSCSPAIVIYAANIRRCQMACTSNSQCRTFTYNQSDKRCEMFADIPAHNGYLLNQVDVITMTTIDSRKLSARKSQTQNLVQNRCSISEDRIYSYVPKGSDDPVFKNVCRYRALFSRICVNFKMK